MVRTFLYWTNIPLGNEPYILQHLCCLVLKYQSSHVGHRFSVIFGMRCLFGGTIFSRIFVFRFRSTRWRSLADILEINMSSLLTQPDFSIHFCARFAGLLTSSPARLGCKIWRSRKSFCLTIADIGTTNDLRPFYKFVGTRISALTLINTLGSYRTLMHIKVRIFKKRMPQSHGLGPRSTRKFWFDQQFWAGK